MTEAELLECENPGLMLRLLWGKDSDRKLRLFVCAVCVQIASGIGNDCLDAVAVAERYAAGQGDDRDLLIATSWLESKRNPISNFGSEWFVLGEEPRYNRILELATRFDGADLLRDIFGNPFRCVSVDPRWLTPTIVSLATAAYTERQLPSGHLDPDRLAVLSDALEEAGCVDAEILSHLRGEGPHVRGCWPLDLLLGKG